MLNTASLIFEDGTVFEGYGSGKDVLGAAVVNTVMTGYLEMLTDASHIGDILVATFPLLGNYGVITEDFESGRLWPSAFIVRECCDSPSNFRSTGSLENLLNEHGVSYITGADTRAITRHIRSHGEMNAAVVYGRRSSDEALVSRIKQHRLEKAVESVTCETTQTRRGNATVPRRVLLYDYGFSRNLLRYLLNHGCDVSVTPAHTPASHAGRFYPDGIILSSGPGDPRANPEMIAEIRQLADLGLPILAIGLGHQMLALAMGGEVERMKFGHRGAGHPVRDLSNGRIYPTAQNHGYIVRQDSLSAQVAAPAYVSAVDGTCEGLRYLNFNAQSVQFRPDAYDGGATCSILGGFVRLMGRL